VRVLPTVKSTEADRSLELYLEVLQQFNVLRNLRYAPINTATFCNIFVWDATFAMGCEIPHWHDNQGRTVQVGKGSEMTANQILDWLIKWGGNYGWSLASQDEAWVASNKGQPAVACYQKHGGIGHVAMVLPGPGGAIHIAQAGRVNLFNEPIAKGFGNLPVTFWTHP
jgi:hypothetical protein